MNLSMWTAIREYIAAEIELGILRNKHKLFVDYDKIPTLEEQSTRMETSIRELIEKEEELLRRMERVVRSHTLLK